MFAKLKPRNTDTPTIEHEPREMDLDLALVMIDGGTAAQTQWTIGSVTQSALDFNGDILQILGSLILVSFGAFTEKHNSDRLRADFVKRLAIEHAIFVRVLHGKLHVQCGVFGCQERKSYTAIPQNFHALMIKLTALQPGEIYEQHT